jgi:ABC-type multidrug transport system permease subunit
MKHPPSLPLHTTGFTIAYNQIPGGWRWMNRIVPTTWVIYALAANQMGSVTQPMTGVGVEGLTVEEYLAEVFGYHYGFRWYALLIAACYMVFFIFLATALMKHVNWLRR